MSIYPNRLVATIITKNNRWFCNAEGIERDVASVVLDFVARPMASLCHNLFFIPYRNAIVTNRLSIEVLLKHIGVSSIKDKISLVGFDLVPHKEDGIQVVSSKGTIIATAEMYCHRRYGKESDIRGFLQGRQEVVYIESWHFSGFYLLRIKHNYYLFSRESVVRKHAQEFEDYPNVISDLLSLDKTGGKHRRFVIYNGDKISFAREGGSQIVFDNSVSRVFDDGQCMLKRFGSLSREEATKALTYSDLLKYTCYWG